MQMGLLVQQILAAVAAVAVEVQVLALLAVLA
jgi:hypothetical protein